MESQRSILIIGLLLVSFLLWIEYQDAYGPKAIEPVAQQQNVSPQNQGIPSAVDTADASNNAIPTLVDNTINNQTSDVPQGNNTIVPAAPALVADPSNVITVKTDTLDIQINLVGGDVVKADLVKYPVTQGATDSYQMLKPIDGVLHIAQSGLIGKDGTDKASGRAKYQTTNNNYELTGDSLTVPLTWQSQDGIVVTKTFTFTRDSHLIQVDYLVQNNKSETAQVTQFAQLKQTLNEIEGGSMFMPIYRGTTYSTQEDKYKKLSFGDIQDEKLRVATIGGWTAMIEHYFVAAWVPPQEQTNTITARLLQNQYAVIGYTGEQVLIPAGQSATLSSQLYVGPKDQAKLAAIANGLDFTVDYGFLWMISQPLFTLLQFLHSLVGNWGVAIILITLIVKGSMYWLTKKQYESMAKMRNLTPKMNQLKERFGDDRQKMSQAMMELYKKEKVNPMGGCFPLLLQMPIFLALYWVLLESVELRHAEFALWITDLSVKDPWYVLPVLTGASMYLLQKLQPMTIQDPLQQKLMQFMPVMMCVFFLWFPSGLVLYWLISNVVTLVQAKIIYASMEKRGIKSK
ncbi:membrane protein insertase YidC [Glaciecola petra]|uniref:Membrane protein insertase YidC n=1 Tax=Glaciecola petra TaxID=3075602 RepID=A0ABU2ZS26_9ALTE|nr:membrane protein insertase YidC [Aestuariibacter sp. P117]MDT0594833.1 membrane protein insertase YidC [Aestuariibacter sp. P117]